MLYQRGADLIAAEHLAAMGGGGGMLGFSATGGGGGGGDRGGGGGGEASLCKKELSLLTRLVDIARGRMAQILKAMRRSAKFATVLTSVDPTVSHWICSGDGKHGGGGGGGVGGGGKRGGGAGGAPPSLGATFEMLMEVQGRMEELRDKRGAQGGGGGAAAGHTAGRVALIRRARNGGCGERFEGGCVREERKRWDRREMEMGNEYLKNMNGAPPHLPFSLVFNIVPSR